LYIAKSSLECTALGHEYVRQVFLNLHPDVEYTFVTDESGKMSRRAHATTIVVDPKNPKRPLYKKKQVLVQVLPSRFMKRHMMEGLAMITFRHHFLDYFQNHMHLDAPEKQVSTLLFFTNLLMHELAHAFVQFVETGSQISRLPVEPHYSFESPFQEHEYAHGSWLFDDMMLTDVACPSMIMNAASALPPDLQVLSK
jgi:hypothetical protein